MVAAGSGTRLGAAEPKALVSIGGQTILEHALSRVFGIADAAQVIVVAPADRLDHARELATRVAGSAVDHVTVVAGGDTRQQSVAAGLAVLEPGVDVVLVHDSARSFTPASQFEAVIAAVRATGGGVIPGLAVADTIKQLDWTGAVSARSTARNSSPCRPRRVFARGPPRGLSGRDRRLHRRRGRLRGGGACGNRR